MLGKAGSGERGVEDEDLITLDTPSHSAGKVELVEWLID